MSDNGDDNERAFAWAPFQPGYSGPDMSGGKDPLGDDLPSGSARPGQVFQSDRSADASVSRLTEVPLHVEAVIGGVSLSVADLTRVREGDALVLDRRFGDPIELRLNGRTIGYGEIVADNDDNLIGIRMTKLTGMR
ncbi:FliM/FliN family flagellar motor switch protein [Rhizobium sp. GN54]|uniref:FliM/FliN family flagellar motor switch protein n=1 Tax=Rhizobium sp. GN54 TaxID=2898150 RepID=UPI001E567008|nr:FliM/FliN family flagellar motor switch protein [Rhizobium sp. GN54]